MWAMGGRLWLVSRPTEGSTFSFSLPLAETGSLFSGAAAVSKEKDQEQGRGAAASDAGSDSATGDGRPVLLP